MKFRLTPCDCHPSQQEPHPWPDWLRGLTRWRFYSCNGCHRSFFMRARRRGGR